MAETEVGAPIRAGNTQMEFTNTLLNNRRLIRSVKNPMDKCTIVSVYPKDIDETKHTIEPGQFHIPAGTYENPGILVVGSSSWWKDVDVEQPMLEMLRSSIEIAESIVKDYCNGMLGCDMSGAMPGLFFALGPHTILDIKTNYKKELEKAKERQLNWFKILVRLADSLWARSNNNPLVISDDMRLAALELNMNEKPWLKDYKTVELSPCKFCGGLRNPIYPICPSCKAIDIDNPLSKDIKFAV